MGSVQSKERLMPQSPTLFLPSTTYEEALDKALKAWGVEPDFYDIWGNHHTVSRPVATSILKSLGVSAGSVEELDQALEAKASSEWLQILPATVVASVTAKKILVNMPETLGAADLHVTYCWEQGSEHRCILRVSELADESDALIDGRRFVRKALP